MDIQTRTSQRLLPPALWSAPALLLAIYLAYELLNR